MGYTHYWYRTPELPEAEFQAFVAAAQQLARAYEDLRIVQDDGSVQRLRLAGPLGTGDPMFERDAVAFNGPEACGHPRRELGIAWPAHRTDESAVASGVLAEADPVAGRWFAGPLLSTRSCGGDCSYESFVIPRLLAVTGRALADERGRIFAFCKTAFKPYDLMVQATLIAAKHTFGAQFHVQSDGEDDKWTDARALCVEAGLGYGADYHIDDNEDVGLTRRSA
jgi:hypothetical protein